MGAYLIYVLLVLAGFAMWAVLFAFMRRSESPRKRKAVGRFFIGPFHGYLESRGYRLTQRELLGWLVVGLLMLALPFIDRLLERLT